MAFWRPGAIAPGLNVDAEKLERDGLFDVVPYNPFGALSMSQQRARLPVFKFREHILFALERYQTLVLVGETGCGKTTQIPQYLHEAGWTADGRIVACLQPRRVAAVSIAQRVAAERGVAVGAEVGYAIRFEECCNPATTRIKYMTEGVLIREMMRDPLLSRYSVIMLDEAHERTVFFDIVVGLLYKIQKKREDLRIIISSATMDAEEFKDYFNANKTADPAADTATIMTIQGRCFPVEVLYLEKPTPNYVKTTVDTVFAIHENEQKGDILVFLTGQEQIDDVVRQIGDRARLLYSVAENGIQVLPMYGGLPHNDQMKIFERAQGMNRKVIVSTNIAEASVTIPNIVYVIDCGFVKMKGYNPSTGIDALVVTSISKASADQRAGRAGRVRSGKVYRLYTEEAYEQLCFANIPEIQRCNLAAVLLQLKALGIDNVLRFPFVSPPPALSMSRSLEFLFAVGAIDDKCQLTSPLGIQMAEFPLEPPEAQMLLSSAKFGCSEDILTIVAMVQVQNIYLSLPNKKKQCARAKLLFSCAEGDLLTYLNTYNAFCDHGRNPKWCHENFLNFKSLVRAAEIREQLAKYMRRFKVPLRSANGDVDAIRRCVVAGFFCNAARLHLDGKYRTIKDNQPLSIHPNSVLYTEYPPPKYVVFLEVNLTSENFMREITVIEPAWLSELAPHYYKFAVSLPSSAPGHADDDDEDGPRFTEKRVRF